MKHFFLFLTLLTVLVIGQNAYAVKQVKVSPQNTLQCAAFSTYVGTLTPNFGAHPSKELIDTLLDQLIKKTPFRCIMTYGVLNGLDAIFTAAEARHIKVIAILWLDDDININSQSIEKGIEVAKAFPKTIIRLSCGSEVRTRHGNLYDGEISRCIDSLHKAGVTQPITTIDTWWEWCNRSLECQQTSFASKVDWIGANIFPWWENEYSGIYSCIPAEKAADFHIARLEDLHRIYPNKEVIMTEFGWPNGPENSSSTNLKTGERCGIASKSNQKLVIESTFKQLAKKKWSGTVFEAFSENWKPAEEGPFGSSWGLCQGTPPYTCINQLKIAR
ncbi:MAG: exo-beta-1,3-glucanase [Methylococcales bacterium]